LGEAISVASLRTQKYRLKTFFPDWLAEGAISRGGIDLIPCRLRWIPRLISSGRIPIDAAFVQVTPPNAAGYCSLGVSVDVAREAMEQAGLVVGEINAHVPRTFGDTFVPVGEFDFLLEAEYPPIYFDRWRVDGALDRVASNVAALIEDGSCLAFYPDPLFEALRRHLGQRRHLGIHSPFISDALMDLINSGAVTNYRKETYRGKTLVSYAIGTAELYNWLNENPLVDFQRIDKVFNAVIMGRNPRFVAVIPAAKVDLTGQITLRSERGNLVLGPVEAAELINAADLSPGGRAVFALPSRDAQGNSNICLSIDDPLQHFCSNELISQVATDFGLANLKGRTLRERAQALIEIAHPDDRPDLVEQAKQRKLLYSDQIFLADSARLYPAHIATKASFKGGLEVRFRAIKPSDEEGMRRLFYRFSDEAVYYRYFHTLRAMPHAKMQQYVNVDWSREMSIVGLVGDAEEERIIAEARYIRHEKRSTAEVVFVVDEPYQGCGIATYLYKMLIRLAKTQGIEAFSAEVLFSNTGAMKVFRKANLPIQAKLEEGIYSLTIPFEH
jgi:acyl-CoA hydrolase/GNAT superfamily N-acetyltransferase